MSKGKKKTVLIGGISVAILAALLILVVCINGGSRDKATAGADTLEVEGTLEADEVDVSAKIPGRLSKVAVEEGDSVQAGQVLALLESKEVNAKVEQAAGALQAARAQQDQAGIAVDLQARTVQDQVAQAEAGLNAAQEKLRMALNGARPQEVEQARQAVQQATAAYNTAAHAYSEQIAQAEAGLNAARAKLQMALNGARPQELEQARKLVEQATAAYNTAKRTNDRFQGLCEDGVIPRQKADEIELQYLSAKAQKEAAEAKLSLVQEGARKEEIAQAREGVKAAEATLRMAKESRMHLAAKAQRDAAVAKYHLVKEGARPEEIAQAREGVRAAAATLQMARDAALQVQIRQQDVAAASYKADAVKGQLNEASAYQSETKILSPISGYISERMSDNGEMVSAGYPIFSVVRGGNFKVKVYADESKFGRLKLNQPVKVVLPALSNKVVNGRVLRISQAADFATRKATNEQGSYDVRSLEIVVKITDDVPDLRVGMTARVRLPYAK